ncbi:hypothetical protein AJ80_04942 [Polytolypa hystricis UAMH7299]|uniref:HAD hydrolase, family IA n=1 Tax=Polytolypa hystricis (strain UAMH7299) TaxID=1447883 RepID=A0A2B7Y7J1_POLH7|nr:hypothetical protein AJ80_04942 [Polytolypa hystricis UAMH7299]
MTNSQEKKLPPIRACLFDMDGLLIDSEELYTKIVNIILQEYGRPSLPWSVKAQLQGRPAPEAGKLFHDWAQLPIAMDEFLIKQTALQKQYFPTTQPLAGVPELLSTLIKTLTTATPVHIALATSSMTSKFELKTNHLRELFSLFPASQVVLGDDPRIGAGRGKPLPDIYLIALETINKNLREAGEVEITPEECLVFEDSVPGVESGRRAGMRVVWVPHVGLLNEYRGREEEVLAGLTGEHKELDGDNATVNKELPLLDGVEKGWRGVGSGSGMLGKLNDGWGELLPSLLNFPYERYGIQVPS